MLLSAVWTLGLLPVAAHGAELPSKFTLGRYVPDDVWMYIHAVSNPERAWIEKQWSEFLGAVANSGVDRDLIGLVLSALPDEKVRADAEAMIEKFSSLVRAVDWRGLFGQEMVFTERFTTRQIGPPEYLAITRGAPGSGEPNIAALVALLNEAASISDRLSVEQTRSDNTDVWSLSFAEAGPDGANMALTLFRNGDVIGAAFGKQLVADALALMAGKDAKSPLVKNARFRAALDHVPPPEDLVSFVDLHSLIGSTCAMVDAACKGKSPMGAEDHAVAQLIEKLGAEVDIVDYIVASMRTEGHREITDNVTRIRPGQENSPLARMILDRRPFDRFDRYVPMQATSFSLTSLIDLERSYKLVLEFIEKNAPEGPEHVAKFKAVLAGTGFDPERDLFSWFSGEMIEVQMPPAVVSPMGGNDWVLMIRIKDKEIATQKVNALIDFVNGLMQGRGQTLMVSPANVHGEGFREITHPLLMMFLRPVIGVKGDWLILGSSAKSINTCLETASGDVPSIAANERFKDEGLTPDGPVRSVSFKDVSKRGQELAAMVGAMGMVGGMVTASMPSGEPKAAKLKQMIQKLLGIAAKLGPAMQKLDFFSSEASMCTYDGKLDLRSRTVITYKRPTEGVEQTARKRPGR
jgi:hypothetical protein